MDQFILSASTFLLGVCLCLGCVLWLVLTRRAHLPEDQQFTPVQATIRGGIFYVGTIAGIVLIWYGVVQIVT
jgi:hypothetical protein